MKEPQKTLCDVYNLTEKQANSVTAFFEGYYGEKSKDDISKAIRLAKLNEHQVMSEMVKDEISPETKAKLSARFKEIKEIK